MAARLRRFYVGQGFLRVRVAEREIVTRDGAVELVFSIDEDRQFYVNRIAFSGNTTTRDKVIRREVTLMEGFVFNSRALDLSRQRLNQLGYFEEIKEEDAKVDPNPNEPKVRRMELTKIGSNIVPTSISDALDLSGYAFDSAVAFRWGDYEIGCVAEYVTCTATLDTELGPIELALSR